LPRAAADPFNDALPWSTLQATQRAAARDAARRAGALPAYRAAWASAGVEDITDESWSRIPTLSKEALIEAASAHPPFGDRLAVPRDELTAVFVAPGPLYMPFTEADLDHVAASFAKALASCGLKRGDLVDQTTMYNWVIAATVMDRALRQLGCAVVPGGIGQSERHVEVIRALRIDAIVAFPTFLEHLLETAAAAGTPLPIKRAVVMGELSHPDAKRRIADAHGVTVREFYGVADAGAVAFECEAGDGMHLRDDLLVEFLAPGSAEAAAPQPGTPAEIVVTDFRREAMPIIRLRTGDLVDEVIAGRCACGRDAARLRRIVGRTSEITKVKGMFVVPRLVEDVLRRRGEERPFRLVVERPDGGRDALTLELAGPPLPDAEGTKSQVENALRLRIDLKTVAELPQGGPRLVDRRLPG
jgi:phenylacetate-CoA ligase